MDYNIKWVNQGGIRESGMTKWIITLYNSVGELVKKIENSERANLNNFSMVNIKLSLTTREALKQTDTNNVLKIFFDEEKDDTKLAQKTMSFDRSRLTVGLSEVEKIDYKVDDVIPMTAKFKAIRGLPAKKFTNFMDHEYVHTQPMKFSDLNNNHAIFIYRKDVEDIEGFIYFANDNFTIQNLDSPTFDVANITKVVLHYWRDWDGVIRNGPYDYIIEDKTDKEYWISTYIGKPYTLPEKKPVAGDTFKCKGTHSFKIGPPGDEKNFIFHGDRNYELVSGTDSKWLKNHSNVDLTFPEIEDCTAYRYTGIKDKYENTKNSKCGPHHGHKKCPGNMCCSSDGWCGGESGKKSDWCHVEKWYQDRPNYLWMWTSANGWRWTSIWGTHFGGSHNFEYDGTNLDGSTIANWWYKPKSDGSTGGDWTRDDRKLNKGDLVKCRNNDPMGGGGHLTYYYDGNNTLLYLWDEKVMKEIIGNHHVDWRGVGDRVIHNCSGVTLGNSKDSA